MVRINYDAFREWLRINKQNQTSAAALAGIDPTTLSKYLTTGKPLPGQVLISWLKAWNWTHEQMSYYCLNGPAPKIESPIVRNYICVEDLLEQLQIIKK